MSKQIDIPFYWLKKMKIFYKIVQFIHAEREIKTERSNNSNK